MYKMDKYQMIAVALLGVNIFTYMILPYKTNIDTGELINGYESFLNWVILIYSSRLVAHLFGINIYNLNGNIVGLSIIAVGSWYIKLFMGKNPSLQPDYFGIIASIISLAVLILILYLDRLQYYTGEESAYLQEK